MSDASSFVKGSKPLVMPVVVKKHVRTKPKAPTLRKPTPRQVKAAQLMVENGRKAKPSSTGEVLREAGYSAAVVDVPGKVTESPTFQALLDQFIPDNDLATVHKRLLNTRKLEHMVFPLEHQDPSDLERPYPVDELLREEEIESRRIIDNMTDGDVIDMLAEVNCVVKRIVHGDTARHVYYWAHDSKAQSTALELAYKMKGHISKGDGTDKAPVLNFNVNNNHGNQTFVKKVDE